MPMWSESVFNPSETFSAERVTANSPASPVQALAPPLFRSTASSRPHLMAFWVQVTGAAKIWFEVKTPVAKCVGPSLTINAKSKPDFLIPAATAPPINPLGKRNVFIAQYQLNLNPRIRQNQTLNWRSGSLDRLLLYLNCRLLLTPQLLRYEHQLRIAGELSLIQ